MHSFAMYNTAAAPSVKTNTECCTSTGKRYGALPRNNQRDVLGQFVSNIPTDSKCFAELIKVNKR